MKRSSISLIVLIAVMVIMLSSAITMSASAAVLQIYDQTGPTCVAEPGTYTTLSVSAAGDSLYYRWFRKLPGEDAYKYMYHTGKSYTILMTEELDGAKYYCRVLDANDDYLESKVMTLYAGTPLTIPEMSDTTRVVPHNEVVYIDTNAAGEGLTYRWYYYTDTGEGPYLSGQDFASMILLEPWDGYTYYCVITDRFGVTKTTHKTTLSVYQAPKIVSQPERGILFEAGKTVTIGIEATGDSLSYKWYYKKISDGVFSLMDETGSSVTLNLDDCAVGDQLYCLVKGAYNSYVQSNIFGLYEPVEIYDQPSVEEMYINEGEEFFIKVLASGYDLDYTWFCMKQGASLYEEVECKDNVLNVVSGEVEGCYCRITDGFGNTVNSNYFNIVAVTPLVVNTRLDDMVTPAGSYTLYTLDVTGVGLIYEWYYKEADDAEFTLATEVDTNGFKWRMNYNGDGRQVYCRITDAAGNVYTTRTATIYLGDPAEVRYYESSLYAEEGEQAYVTAVARGIDLTYEWYVRSSENGIFDLNPAVTGDTYTLTMSEANDGVQVYCQVTDFLGNTDAGSVQTFRCGTEAAIVENMPYSKYAKQGETVTVSFEVVGSGLTYEWYYADYDEATGSYADYKLTTTFTGNSYSVVMNDARNRRKIKCVATDKFGNSVEDYTYLYMGVKTRFVSVPSKIVAQAGETVTVNVEAVGEGLTYYGELYYDDFEYSDLETNTTGTYTFTMDEKYDGGTLYMCIEDKYGEGFSECWVPIALGTSLKITAQPKSVTVAEGATAKVSLTAEGEGLSYKWYFKNKGTSTFVSTSAFTGNSYAVKMDDSRDGRQLYCVVTDAYGNSVQSDTATISMGAELKITGQPKSVTVASGETAKLTVTAEGDGLTYQWYFKEASGSTYYKSSTKTATYEVAMNSTRDGRQLYCVVTDAYGNSVQSDTATISMGAELKITGQPKSVTVASGATAKVTLTAEGEGLTYTWYFKNKGTSSFAKTSSFTGNSYAVAMDSTRDGRQVYCVVGDKYGNTVKSDTATISMAKTVKITAQPQSVIVAEGEMATVKVTATGDGLTYKWYWAAAGSDSYAYTSTFSGSTYKVEMTSARDGRKVYCVVSDKYGNTVKSATATMSME